MNFKANKTLLLSAIAMSLGLTSCVDDNYDLGNIDTTIGIKVKDLTVAMNLEDIKLEKVMDLSDDSQIKEVVDPCTGKKIYAIFEEGTFESNKINISDFSTNAPDIERIEDALPLEYINKEVRAALDNEIKKAVDIEIDRQKAELILQYQQEYLDTKAKLVADAIKQAEEQIAPYPLPEEKRQEIEEQVVAEMEKNLGYTYADIASVVGAEVEAQRDDIRQQQINDPAVREHAQEVAWASIKDDEVFARYDISNAKTSFSTESKDVDKALRSLSHITAKTTIAVKLELTNLKDILDVVIVGTKIQMPRGLEMTVVSAPNKEDVSYDPKSGVLNIGDVALKDGHYEITLEVDGIDVQMAGIDFVPQKDAPGSFNFSNELGVISGQVNITKLSFIKGNTIFDLPDHASYICTPNMTDIKILAVTGKIQYDIEEPNIDPVYVNDLPSLLTNDETSILLGNPQIYLSVNNPLAEDKVYPQLGLQITSVRDNVADNSSCRLDNGHIELRNEQNIFCLSPEAPVMPYTGFEGAKHEKYSGLSSIFAGKGMPKRLDIAVEDPQIREQEVNNFRLGRDIEAVTGKYTFYAPLNLVEGSIIVYRDTIDGWAEDIEKLTIEKLELNAKVVSNLPLSAQLTIKPIDKNGKELRNVECNAVEIKAQASDQDVHFSLKAPNGMTGLDGIILHATILGDASTNSLSPEQTITVKSAKVTVSGQYVEPDED